MKIKVRIVYIDPGSDLAKSSGSFTINSKEIGISLLSELIKNEKYVINVNDKIARIGPVDFILIIKGLFCNSGRWRIKQTVKDLKEKNIDTAEFILFTEKALNLYHEEKSKKGIKTNYKFLDEIKSITGKQLRHRKDVDVKESIEVLKEWKDKYLDITNEAFFDFILESTDSKYKKTTLRRYFPTKK